MNANSNASTDIDSNTNINPISIDKMTVPQKAKQIAKLLKAVKPDYFYLKELFRQLRKELNIEVQNKPKNLPYVPSEEEIKKYYDVVWHSQNIKHMIMIKTMLYTGVRVGELVKIKIDDVDLKACQIRINKDNIRINNNKKTKTIKSKKQSNEKIKNRIVPFPASFKEGLATYIKSIKKEQAEYLFEPNLKKPYSVRGIRAILANYTSRADMKHTVTPHKLRHFLFKWMKKQKIDDILLHAYSGHEFKQSLEIYSKLSIADAQTAYNQVIKDFPV